MPLPAIRAGPISQTSSSHLLLRKSGLPLSPLLPSISKALQQILITCALSDKHLLQETLSQETNKASTSDLLRQFQGSVPRVWAKTNTTGLAEHRTPVAVQLGDSSSSPGMAIPVVEQAFDKLKATLTSAPVLALPDISTLFWLFVHKKQEIAKGVLTQTLRPWSRPVTYLSKNIIL
ncbi:Pol polyprotein [Plecturocebus cupreus]